MPIPLSIVAQDGDIEGEDFAMQLESVFKKAGVPATTMEGMLVMTRLPDGITCAAGPKYWSLILTTFDALKTSGVATGKLPCERLPEQNNVISIYIGPKPR